MSVSYILSSRKRDGWISSFLSITTRICLYRFLTTYPKTPTRRMGDEQKDLLWVRKSRVFLRLNMQKYFFKLWRTSHTTKIHFDNMLLPNNCSRTQIKEIYRKCLPSWKWGTQRAQRTYFSPAGSEPAPNLIWGLQPEQGYRRIAMRLYNLDNLVLVKTGKHYMQAMAKSTI